MGDGNGTYDKKMIDGILGGVAKWIEDFCDEGYKQRWFHIGIGVAVLFAAYVLFFK